MYAIINTLKDSTSTNVTFKLRMIILLNAIDGILTYISLYYNYATEENPIADLFIHDFNLMILFKILIPTLLIVMAMVAIYNKGVKRPIFVNSLVTTGLIVYALILLNHFYVLSRLVHYLAT